MSRDITEHLRYALSTTGSKDHAAWASERDKYWRDRKALCGRSVETIGRSQFNPLAAYSCKDCVRKVDELLGRG